MKTITFRNETEYKKDSWYHVTIEDLIEKGILYKPMDGNHGNIHPTAKDYVESGIPFLLASDVQDDKIDLTNCKFISRKTADNLQKGFANEGDVLLTHKGTVGNVALVPSIESEYVMLTPQVTYYRVRDKERLNNIFLKFMFQSEYFQNQLNVIGKGATRNYIGILAQQKLKVMIPESIHEQKKVANILSTWDKAIELKEKLIEQKKEQKKGLMQKLLTGKVRLPGFEGEWTHYKLGMIVSNKSGSFDSGKEQEVKKCVELEHINSETATINGYIGSDESKSMKNVFYKGDILFGKLRPYLRKYWQATFDGVCSSEIWVLKPADPKILSINYLNYIVQTEVFINTCNKTTGSKMPRADWGHLSDLTLYIPPNDEQEGISNLLNVLDNEIGLLKTEVKALQEQKKGLMQLLLTGKVRVKV